ncbi:Armadillo repeat-containing protein 3 [Chytriomyces hyalinus]|nr:Armadillo repeat-containing protein 3 [Chytriomyces hyalinus]
MRKKELLETLVSLLAVEEPPEVQDEAAFAISNLAKDFALKSEIRKAGGIKALVKLLPAHDPDVKKNTALALSSLLEDFTNRSEIRYVNGLAPLLELLGAEFPEIQENTLMSLILCAEDQSNRVEIRRANGIKRLIDMLGQDVPELHQWTLLCLSKCLEDSETVNIFPEIGGLPPVMKMLSSEDVRAKRNASLVLSKVARNDRNQNFIREAGALQVLISNLNHPDPGTVSHAALALGALAKTEINQLELNKAGAVEIFIKLLAHEDVDICRQSAFALSSLCLNTPNRIDAVKFGGVSSLLAALNKADTSVQASACLALARCMQEGEARVSLAKEKKNESIARLIALVLSKEVTVARNAAYALSNASQHELNASLFCQMGAIEALLALGKDATKSSQKFSHDALDKLLNYNLAAKYWLRNELSATNIIKSGFYDIGSAGANLDAIKSLPSLAQLSEIPADKRREVLVLDFERDQKLSQICQAVATSLDGLSSRQQLRQIAVIVSNVMGGPVEPGALSEFAFKFKMTELKMKAGNNVIPIGQVYMGTFYHRALLFKAICDKVGLGPCQLIRGDYNRAWNIVDIRKQKLSSRGRANSAVPPRNLPPSREMPVGSTGTSYAAGGLSSSASVPPINGFLPSNWTPPSEPEEFPAEATIVDLMFEPGRLMEVNSQEANFYRSPS